MNKPHQLTIIAALLLAFTGCNRHSASSTPTLPMLEANYTKAATEFQSKLEEGLQDPATQDRLLANARRAAANCNAMEQQLHRKLNSSPPAPREIAGITICDLTTKPPTLNEDKTDLYARYKSTVNMDLKIDSASSVGTASEGWIKFTVSLPVGADANGVWKFPVLEDVFKPIQEHADGVGDALSRELDMLLKLNRETP